MILESADAVTALFEIGAAYFCWSNVFAIIRDKEVRGTSYGAPAFFAMLGIWQVVIFAMTIGPMSSACAALVAAANITWLVLAIKYRWGTK